MSRVCEDHLLCLPEQMIDMAKLVAESTGWLIAYGWLWPTKASFLHSRNLFAIQIAMAMIATVAAIFKCPVDGQVRNVDFTISAKKIVDTLA
jgi:hypothetical protein